MAYTHTQVPITIDGVTYYVPDSFAALYEYMAATGGGVTILGDTVGEFEGQISELSSLIKSFNWASIKGYMEQAGAHLDPDMKESYETVSAFAAGNFSLLDEGFNALRDFLSKYPDSTPLLEAFADIDGYGEALDDGLHEFVETLANQQITGSATQFDITEFTGQRADYSLSLDSNGHLVITGPLGGSAILQDIEQLKFGDYSYNLEIAEKAQEILPEVLDSLVDLYVAYFNRAPEAKGLQYWIDEYQGGKSLDAIAVEFYNAGVQFSEQTGYTNDMPLSNFISVLYENVLGRFGDTAPPQADIDYWVEQVENNLVTREGLVARFLQDARQFADDPQFGWVSDLLDNRVAFGKIHAVQFGIDYSDEASAYEQSQELAALVTPEGFDAAIGMIGLSADDYIM